MSKKIGVNIIKNTKRRMQELGWNQGLLAEKMGCKQPVISRFLAGTYSPTIGYIEKLAGVLGVTPIALMMELEIDSEVEPASVS